MDAINEKQRIVRRSYYNKTAKAYDKTPAQIVLRWHVAHNRVVIPKSKTPSRIRENHDIFDFNLELTEIAEIDSLNRNARQGKDPMK